MRFREPRIAATISPSAAGIGPGLRVFLRELDLDHHVERNRLGIQPRRQLHRIDRIDRGKQLRGLFRLVRLQMPDQVEARALQIRHRRRLSLHFLHVVFAELAQTGGPRLANHLGAENFGDGEQAHSRRIAVRTGAGALDPPANQIQPLGK